MNFKELSAQELKEKYSNRHGFIFKAAGPCNPNNCDKVAYLVKEKGFAEEMPEFVTVLQPNLFAFVYPENSVFYCGSFFQTAQQMSAGFGVFQVDILSAFLKELN